MTKKKNLKFILAFCLIAVVSALTMSLTGAWFTSNKHVGGTVTMGVVDINIYNGTTSVGNNATFMSKTALPGDKILTSALTLKSANATTSAFLRLTVFVTNASVNNVGTSATAGGVNNLSPGSSWYKVSNDTVSVGGVSYARITYVLGTSSAATAKSAADIKAGTGLDIYSGGIYILSSSTSTAGFSIYIRVDAIQSSGITATPTGVNSALGAVTKWDA